MEASSRTKHVGQVRRQFCVERFILRTKFSALASDKEKNMIADETPIPRDDIGNNNNSKQREVFNTFVPSRVYNDQFDNGKTMPR